MSFGRLEPVRQKIHHFATRFHLILVSYAPSPPSTLQEDNYGNTPIMMGVRYGTSDVLMVMLNSRHDTFNALKRQAGRIEQ
jgi:hypothetical protein